MKGETAILTQFASNLRAERDAMRQLVAALTIEVVVSRDHKNLMMDDDDRQAKRLEVARQLAKFVRDASKSGDVPAPVLDTMATIVGVSPLLGMHPEAVKNEFLREVGK